MTYAGDVSPRQAWELLGGDPDVTLVDVRTHAEWSYVGLPDLESLGRQVVTVEWTTFPDGDHNERFVEELHQAGLDPAAPVLFICRSGVRSQYAAEFATSAGFQAAYNVAEGFEGNLDDTGHRGVGGWKAAGLPWRQT